MFVVDWLHRQAQRRPHKTALVDLASGRSLSYLEFDQRASRVARTLLEQWRLEPGARVAVLASNGAEYMEWLFGCAKAGTVMVCLNWRLPAAELGPVLDDCAPSAFVCSEEFAATADTLLAQREPIPRAMIGGSAASRAKDGSAGWPRHEDLLAAAAPGVLEMPPTPMDSTWYLLYTSGTTGKPKGVIQTFGMAFFNAVNLMLASRLSDADSLLSVLPYFHTGGLNLHAIPLIHAGGTVEIMKQFEPGAAIERLESGVSMFFGVPAIYLFIGQHPRFARADFSRVRHWGAGGSPMPLAQIRHWADRGVTVCFGYGMTETGPTVFLPDADTAALKPGTVGKPVGATLVRVVDARGRDCGPNERGELLVKGPTITPGYWQMPELTAASIVDGWLHTGDVAYFDDDGDFWIVDRVKDMFISGGENVYPAEVENVLFQMPQVAEAAVLGVPDERWVEAGLAVVVARPGMALDAEMVRAFCRERLAGYKVPRHVQFVEVLPRTPAGKVEKTKLLARFAGGH
jgi:fatty-acyl-CoA synthase